MKVSQIVLFEWQELRLAYDVMCFFLIVTLAWNWLTQKTVIWTRIWGHVLFQLLLLNKLRLRWIYIVPDSPPTKCHYEQTNSAACRSKFKILNAIKLLTTLWGKYSTTNDFVIQCRLTFESTIYTFWQKSTGSVTWVHLDDFVSNDQYRNLYIPVQYLRRNSPRISAMR